MRPPDDGKKVAAPILLDIVGLDHLEC